MEIQCSKEYVSVNLDVDQNGGVHPRFFAGQMAVSIKLTS